MKKRNLIISSLIVLILILAGIAYFLNKSNIMTAKQSEIYEESKSSNKKITKLSSITVEPIKTATASNTVTIQQGNLYAYVNTALTSSPENAGQYRSTFGIGEKVVLVAQFDKLIKTTSGAKITIQFGTGALISLNGRISGSTIIFEHTLRENTDNGLMQVKALTGTVTDNDGNTIQIGLPQNGVQYTQANSITADTIRPKISSLSLTANETKTELYATFVYGEVVYNKKDNALLNMNAQQLASMARVSFIIGSEEYNGKGSISNCAVAIQEGKLVCTYKYTIAIGDNGIPVAKMSSVSDIAGNLSNNGKDIAFVPSDININTYWTPSVANITYSANGNNVKPSEGMATYNYCNAGKVITVNVTFNDKVYANNQKTELNEKNASPILLNIGGATRQAKYSSKSSDGRTITYTYTIQAGDNGELQSITVPEGVVYDNVGHKSRRAIKETEYIIVDTIAPQMISATRVSDAGIYKAQNEISCKVKFSEIVYNGSTILIFSESSNGGVTIGTGSNNWTAEKTVKYTIRPGDNGYAKVIVNEGAFKDPAGNKIVANTLSITDFKTI